MNPGNPYRIDRGIPFPPRQHYQRVPPQDDPHIVETLLNMNVGDSVALSPVDNRGTRDTWYKTARRHNMKVAFRDIAPQNPHQVPHTRVWLVYRPPGGQEGASTP